MFWLKRMRINAPNVSYPWRPCSHAADIGCLSSIYLCVQWSTNRVCGRNWNKTGAFPCYQSWILPTLIQREACESLTLINIQDGSLTENVRVMLLASLSLKSLSGICPSRDDAPGRGVMPYWEELSISGKTGWITESIMSLSIIVKCKHSATH